MLTRRLSSVAALPGEVMNIKPPEPNWLGEFEPVEQSEEAK